MADIHPDVYENILAYVPGDQLYGSNGLIDGYVTAVEAQAQETPVLSVEDGLLTVSTEADDRLTLTFTIEGYVTDPITNSFGTQEARIGDGYIVKTIHFELSGGVVTNVIWH